MSSPSSASGDFGLRLNLQASDDTALGLRPKDGSLLNPDVLRRDVRYPTPDHLGITRNYRAAGFHTFRQFCRNDCQPRNRQSEARTETAWALQAEHDGRFSHAHDSRRRSKCCARIRKGDLWRSVPSCCTFWNMEQQRRDELGNSCTRLKSQL